DWDVGLGSLVDEWEWLQNILNDDERVLVDTNAEWLGTFIIAIGQALLYGDIKKQNAIDGGLGFKVNVKDLYDLSFTFLEEIKKFRGKKLEIDFDVYYSIKPEEMFDIEEPSSVEVSFIRARRFL
ncbi:hypothetical protein KAU11_04385, partial [Candidatus Babeliales bacterium]|nr:hypothetical protein [Candidatus Babeliales bacterium]